MRLVFFIPLLISAAVLSAQNPPANMPPNELVRQVVRHELEAENQDHTHWMYRSVENVPSPKKTTTVVETATGDTHYLDDVNGQPLTPQQRSAEDQRIQHFIGDPAQQRKARKEGDADSKKSAQLFSMLPEAFIFDYAGSTGNKLRLNFHPNPKFTSHSSESYVFHKMDGFVVVDAKENRLVEISGRLTHGVAFAGGLLGHLDPGGTFDVRREAVAPGHWAITRLVVNMNGKILFFKTIAEKQDETDGNFQRVPDNLTLAQAEGMARKQAAPAGTSGN